MLWLALYFPELPLEVFNPPRDTPFAVTARRNNRDVIARCNQVATQQGVNVGLDVSSALALCQSIQLQARDEAGETRQLHELAQWAYQYSNKICFEPLMLLLEIGASLRLFEGQDKLLAQILADLQQLQHSTRYAIAPNATAAALLARSKSGTRVVHSHQLPQQLGDIPLRRFIRDEKVRRLINDIGLDTLEDCTNLPRKALARRNAPLLLQQLDMLYGRAAKPLVYWQPPSRFSQTLKLLSEISHSQALVFPAKRLLTTLCGYLRGRGAGTQLLLWQIAHREHSDSAFKQGLLNPERDTERLLASFRERIERLSLVAPVISLRLVVEDCLPFSEQSKTLFDKDQAQDQLFIERLYNRLGKHKVQGISLTADHRPEHAWRLCPPGKPHAVTRQAKNLPAWLLTQAKPLSLHKQQPWLNGELKLQAIPMRIESGWWDNQDIARDYYVAITRKGERLWVYQDRRSQQWFLHGRFD